MWQARMAVILFLNVLWMAFDLQAHLPVAVGVVVVVVVVAAVRFGIAFFGANGFWLKGCSGFGFF